MSNDEVRQLIIEAADRIYADNEDELSLAMSNFSAAMLNIFEKVLTKVMYEFMQQNAVQNAIQK